MKNAFVIKRINYILGNQCNSDCAHCFTNANSNSKSKLDFEKAIEIYKSLNQSKNIREIHFNGGEPFLYIDSMSKIINEIIQDNPKIKIKIATGANEFNSLESIRLYFSKLKKINELWVSFDFYHLKKTPISNYQLLNQYCNENKIKIIFSICYSSISELAETLNLIKESKLTGVEIAKQPIYPFGRAKNLGIKNIESNDIPKDYKCPEIDIVTVWPNSKLSICSALCARNGKIDKKNNSDELQNYIKNDQFFNLRNKLSFQKIAEVKEMSGAFDVSSPCATCNSILEKWMVQNGK